MTTTADVKRYREFLADEADGVFMYAALADLEEDEDPTSLDPMRHLTVNVGRGP